MTLTGSEAPDHERLDRRRRETVPASELVVSVRCGGSDAFSDLTANPAVGFCSDLLVRAGTTVMFSETTEVRDCVSVLTARAATSEVAAALVREKAWHDAYLQPGQGDRSANTTPGNKQGGLSNIVEKAMGSIVKSGTAPISHGLAPGEKLNGRRGLVYAATPASDFICGTLQLGREAPLAQRSGAVRSGADDLSARQAGPVDSAACRSSMGYEAPTDGRDAWSTPQE